MKIRIKRVYGLKDIAPSTELRKWFGHSPGRGKSSTNSISLNSEAIASKSGS
jgi:uncharacterized protein YeaO (DUF488 family)